MVTILNLITRINRDMTQTEIARVAHNFAPIKSLYKINMLDHPQSVISAWNTVNNPYNKDAFEQRFNCRFFHEYLIFPNKNQAMAFLMQW